MSTPHRETDEDLELPPEDGESEEDDTALAEDDELVTADDPNALDDKTGEGDPVELDVDGAEGGWLEGSEEAGVDVASFDVAIGGETALLDDVEVEGHATAEDFDGIEDVSVDDGGEEGPLAEDDSIREEDLPQLDADDEADVPDDALYDPSLLAAEDELRWDDRAWARAPAQDVSVLDQDDSGVLAVPGERDENPRDARWRALEELGNVSAAAFVPGGSVLLAIEKPNRTLLVRIVPDGEAGIIAEIEGGNEARVTHLKWDVANGWIVAFGPFGVQAFRPV